ncbi:MAG: 3-hydroxyacyl-ACP dehydratase FabZ family protein [Planctomycetota bacterium]
MKYCQLDRITELSPGKSIAAQRTLRPDEEYLEDHFPRFPVMPGVMMLEALHQAGVWLIRMSPHFDQSVVLLREARNVRFGDFLSPGETLDVEAEIIKIDQAMTTIKAAARKGDRVTVSARLIFESCSSGDPAVLGTDADIMRCSREQFFQLYGDNPPVAAVRRPDDGDVPTMNPNMTT